MRVRWWLLGMMTACIVAEVLACSSTLSVDPDGVDGGDDVIVIPTDAKADVVTDAGSRVAPTGDASVVDFAVPLVDGGAEPLRIARGPDGTMWMRSRA